MSWTAPSPQTHAVLALSDARDVSAAGAKAAALARAAEAGLPVLPGFVLMADSALAVAGASAGDDPAVAAARQAWASLTDRGQRPLVVRSSSAVEDGVDSSMAGRFTSVLDVRGWDAFARAVADVVASGEAVHQDLPGGGGMAVLVQPFLEPQAGGVMFGVDPVTGRRDRYVVSAVPGGPDRLVSGEVDGTTVTLTTRGRVVEASGTPPITGGQLRALVRLQRRAAAVFGAPQDIEWAVVDGSVVLLQSRPVTATGTHSDATGPVLGPGPVAETFPEPLSPLEHDLWVPPMAEAIREVLSLTGAHPASRLAASPVIANVGGRVAADLELLGLERTGGRARSLWAKVDPRPPLRRLKVAWSVGRLRAALPALARDTLGDVDRLLADVPHPGDLSDRELLGLLDRVGQALRSVQGYEMLAGQLLDAKDAPVTAAAQALRVLALAAPGGNPASVEPDELVARHPVLLALVPPAIGVRVELPQVPETLPPTPEVGERQVLREALRLRARWLHELTARAALALGGRLAAAGRIARAADVRWLSHDTLRAAVLGGTGPVAVTRQPTDVAPLPARFRLTADGTVVPVRSASVGATHGGGRRAGGGRASGTVASGKAVPDGGGAVLVVRTLDPGLAHMLPGLRGLVSETGSVLSHLAILARELGVPTVVGVEDAVARFPAGTDVVVDGDTGEVSALRPPTALDATVDPGGEDAPAESTTTEGVAA
jgi:rifampicin phosphotransferase